MNKQDWTEYGIYGAMEGSEDWQHVVSLVSGGGYDWTELHAFYSPSARRFFWHGDTGCSCSHWGMGLAVGDFEDGDRDALLRSLEGFASEYDGDMAVQRVLDAHRIVRTWRPEVAVD